MSIAIGLLIIHVTVCWAIRKKALEYNDDYASSQDLKEEPEVDDGFGCGFMTLYTYRHIHTHIHKDKGKT